MRNTYGLKYCLISRRASSKSIMPLHSGRFVHLLLVASLACSASASGPTAIKHVITLMMENHSFNNLLGWLPGIGDIESTDFNFLNASDPVSPKIFASGAAARAGVVQLIA